MADAIAIRKKVAELCGYVDICLSVGVLGEVWTGCKQDCLSIILPHYELSLDAITQAFDEHGLSYMLSKRVDENGDIRYFAVGSQHSAFSDTAAKAMCYLFIHCMENVHGKLAS